MFDRTIVFVVFFGSSMALARAQTTERISVSPFGAQGSQGSVLWPGEVTAISADGRFVVFSSSAPNLVHGDTNGRDDVFLRDRQTGQTTRISVTPLATQTNHVSTSPSISSDARYVVYQSHATNLVHGDTNGATDVFVRDLSSFDVERVSVSSSDEQANDTSQSPALSADGRWVAFQSHASNLVPGDTNAVPDVFVRDRATERTVRVSVDSSGAQATDASSSPAISAHGRFVAFASLAADLVPGDMNATGDVFLHDLLTAQTSLVSVDSSGAQGNDTSTLCAISGDGRYVAFESRATNLVAGDTNHCEDVFVRDLVLGTTIRVSVSTGGVQGDGASISPAISADGRYVAFASAATNLVANDTNVAKDVFVHDLQIGETLRVSGDSNGVFGDADSYAPSISADGRFIAFESVATNLVLADTNVVEDVFLHDRIGSTPFGPFCFGDGSLVTACPCAPPNTVPTPSGGAGRGCANSFNALGGLLVADGHPSPDTIVFTGEIGTSYVGFAFLVKGDAASAIGIANGDGVRCVDGALVRFGGHAAGTNGAAAGYWTYPNGAQTISVSAVTGQAPGQSAHYQLFYRNAAPNFCSSGTTNWTNGLHVVWQ